MTDKPAAVRHDVAGHTATITLDRPDRHNAFTVSMCLELLDILDEVDRDDRVRAVVVTGSGRHFCVGADLDEGFVVDAGATDPVSQAYIDRTGRIEGLPRDGGGVIALRFAQCSKPVIAAVNGSAVGVGATMTLPMDIRVIGEHTRFGFVFARRGLVPEGASTWFLPRMVGIARALEWTVTGRLIPAAEAEAAGLASHRVADDVVVDRAMEIAAEIGAQSSPVAVAATRRLLWETLTGAGPWDAHVLETRTITDLVAGPDVAEGVASFLARRSPGFTSTAADMPDFLASRRSDFAAPQEDS